MGAESFERAGEVDVQMAVNIVVLASIYAMISCGYVLIYRVSRVLNLAHGELMMLGAYLLLTVATGVSANPAIALGFAAFLSLTAGALIYVVLVRQMTGQSALAAILVTIALGIFLRGMMVLLWSAQLQYPGHAIALHNPPISITSGVWISTFALVTVLVNIAVYAALFALLRFSSWGIRMRATGQNPLLAAQRGINLHAVYAMAWSISTFTGATVGILISLDSGLDSTMAIIGLKAFPAALVGGLDSLLGALIGSLIVAAAEVITIQHVDPLLSDVVPFLILIVMLIVRPWGLFGTREELDRV